MSSKEVVMDIDYILGVGWGQFTKGLHFAVNEEICTSNKDKVANERVKALLYEKVNSLFSAIASSLDLYAHDKSRSEQRYHLFMKLLTRTLFADEYKIIRPKEPYDRKDISILVSIAPYAVDRSLDALKKAFKIAISESLVTKDDREKHKLLVILGEIKYVWEYQQVLMFVDIFGRGEHEISSIPDRDRKKEYRKKEKFNKEKEQALAFLRDNNIELDSLAAVEGAEYKEHVFEYRQTTMKAVSESLYTSLVSCGTGKVKAKTISKIIDLL